MKVGDLVCCPVDLETGEMFADNWELAIIKFIYENEPKISVTYVNECSEGIVDGTWYTSEIELISEAQ